MLNFKIALMTAVLTGGAHATPINQTTTSKFNYTNNINNSVLNDDVINNDMSIMETISHASANGQADSVAGNLYQSNSTNITPLAIALFSFQNNQAADFSGYMDTVPLMSSTSIQDGVENRITGNESYIMVDNRFPPNKFPTAIYPELGNLMVNVFEPSSLALMILGLACLILVKDPAD